MKKIVSLILAFVIIIGTVANAAPGDIFHSGLNKTYSPDSPDLIDAILGGANVSQFYREVEGNKFVNIVEEENRQVQYLQGLKEQHGFNTPKELDDYIKNNAASIKKEFEAIANEIAVDKNKLPDSKVPILETPYNYSKPVPGSEVNHTQIINLLLPKGGKDWVYEVGKVDFKDLKVDTVTKDMKSYSSGSNIPVVEGDYLFLGAIDDAGKLKAYVSIKVSHDMINNPRIEAKLIDSLNPTIGKSNLYSGATKVSGDLGPATWKLAPIDTGLDTVVYVDSRFADAKDYNQDGTDLVVANDSQLDNGLEGFEKHIIIYSEKDTKIDKYKIFKLDKDVVSGLSVASRLKNKVEENPGDYNYSTPTKGKYAGTIQIEELDLEDVVGASKWMYAKVKSNDIVPNQDRVYLDSTSFEMGDNIGVLSGDLLMILATDAKGKVRAFDIVKILPKMIKDPLATKLEETADYKGPVKGDGIGSTEFTSLKHTGVTTWNYKVSDKAIDTPELGSSSAGYSNVNTSGGAFNLIVEDDPIKLKANNFKKHMMIYGINSDDEVIAYKDFVMDDSNVRMPLAGELVSPGNYSGPSKGSSANTTKFGELLGTGFGKDLKFRYKVLDNPITEIEFNSKFPDTHELRPNINVPVSVDKDLLVLAVDSAHKTKAFTTIKLTFDHVQAGAAPKLDLKTNYVGPVPGGTSNSSSFSYLKAPTQNSEFVYIIGDSKFDIPELGSTVTGTSLRMVEGKFTDITSLTPGKHLLLLAIDVGDEEGKGKVLAYEQFKLSEDQVKGGSGIELDQQAYKIMPGDNPSTTRLRLEALGITNPNSIHWRYKLVADKDPTDIPYFNKIVDSTAYPVKANTFLGPDIPVVKDTDGYGRILILATDRDGRTKAYANVPITKDDVKEHADKIGTSIAKGNIVDSVKFTDLTGLDSGNKYKYLISDTRPETPATGDDTPSGRIPYNKVDEAYPDIPVHIGKWISLYEVDSEGKVVKFNSFEVKEVAQGAATLTVNPPGDILEGTIVKGGTSFIITLADPKLEDDSLVDAKWAKNITTKAVLDKLFQGFKANSETAEWARVVERMVAEGNANVTIVDKLLSITLSSVKNYNISQDQIINLTIPHEAIEGALNPIQADGSITIKPTVGASISGDVVNSIVREDDIKAGGKTIVITLDDGSWVTDLASNPANKKTLIDGFTGDSNWNAIAKNITDLVRTSKNEATITLPPMPTGINLTTTPSAISLKIPEALIQGAGQDVVANPDFILYPNKIQVVGNVDATKDTVTLQAPDYKIVDPGSDTWIINVTTGALKDMITDKDLDIIGLPRGLKANVIKVDGQNQIQIKITENASASLASNTIIKVKIKGNAVTDPNAEDSNEIELKLIRGGSNIDKLKNVRIDIATGMLMDSSFNPMKQLASEDIEFSLNSTTGINGDDWSKASEINTKNITFKPGKVFVRDANNKRVFHSVATIANPGKAPTGITVAKVDYDGGEMGVSLKLPPNDLGYEYRTNDVMEWTKVTSETSIKLKAGSDLRVRFKATEKLLPSLPTNQIRVLDLSGVKMDVGKGIIENTTTQMQYSLDDITYYPVKPNIPFVEGVKVWIRESGIPANKRSLGKVEQQDFIESELEDVKFKIKDGKIINATDLQYRIGDSKWKDVGSGTGIEFLPGSLQFRKAGTPNKLPSIGLEKIVISTPLSPPDLLVDDLNKDIKYRVGDAWKSIDNILEFKIDNELSWTNGSKWDTDKIMHENADVSLRFAATEDRLPSQFKVVNFTKNLTFNDVKLNVLEGYLENTTSNMQYSTNANDSGIGGTWTNCATGTRTKIDLVEGMKVWIREKDKIENKIKAPLTVERLLEPDLSSITYDVSLSIISKGDSVQDIQYRIGDDEDWKDISNNDEVIFKPGTLKFRTKSTIEKLPSFSVALPVGSTEHGIIKARASAPTLAYDDTEYTITKIGTSDGSIYEYSINGGPWINGTIDTQFNGKDKVKIRVKSTESALSSQEQPIEFSPNLNLYNLVLDVSKGEISNTSIDMQYSLDSTDGVDGSWHKCSSPNTSVNLKVGMTVWVRQIKKPRNKQIVSESEIAEKDLTVDVMKSIGFNVLNKTITITTKDDVGTLQPIVSSLQYRNNSDSWINVNPTQLVENQTNVIVSDVDFKPGKLEFRLKGDETSLPSPIKTIKDHPSIGAKLSAPVVKIDDVKNKVSSINGVKTPSPWGSFEYSLDGNPWSNGKYLEAEDLSGGKKLRIRSVATATTLPSEESNDDFTPNLQLNHVTLSTHRQPLELNGTTSQMEYMVNDNGKWWDCMDTTNGDSNGNTKLRRANGEPLNNINDVNKIIIRDKDESQHENKFSVVINK